MDRKRDLLFKVIFNKDLLNYITKNFVQGEKIDKLSVEKICSQGHSNLLNKHIDEFKLYCNTNCVEGAVKNGHLSIIKSLHKNCIQGFTSQAMDYVAESGNLNILK
jgi:hypothetical protein